MDRSVTIGTISEIIKVTVIEPHLVDLAKLHGVLRYFFYQVLPSVSTTPLSKLTYA